VFAAVERGGRIKATVLPSRRGPALKRQVIEWVDPASIIITDDWPAYHGFDRHFLAHSRINHSERIYVQGSTHTNTVEGYFGHLKPAIKGTYRKVSHRWLQGYLNEFTWRRNAQPRFRLDVRAATCLRDARLSPSARWDRQPWRAVRTRR
jgi:IS1 family transposase